MLNLIKLEFKKTKLGWYYKGAVIANLCILGFLCLIGSEEKILLKTKWRWLTRDPRCCFSELL